MIYKVIVGSTNPVKIAAVNYAFNAVFTSFEIDCTGVNAPSGVADPRRREWPRTVEYHPSG